MKQIIRDQEQNANVIQVSHMTFKESDIIVGVWGSAVYLCRDNFSTPSSWSFVALNGASGACGSKPSIKQLVQRFLTIEEVISGSDTQVFVFQTNIEFAKWLVKNCK